MTLTKHELSQMHQQLNQVTSESRSSLDLLISSFNTAKAAELKNELGM